MEAGQCESLVGMYGNFLGRNRKVTSGADKRWGWRQLSQGPGCQTGNPGLEDYIDFGRNYAFGNTFEARTLTFMKIYCKSGT